MVATDRYGLERIERVVNPREVWAREADDFTPWLAENIDLLGDALGMTLSVKETEVAVGDFKLDILAFDGADRAVVIENQLERTDHTHLGQCLVYASGLEAVTIVWIAQSFRDEFRQSFEWLNEHTSPGIRFFGIEIGVVRVGNDGPMAPVLDVVVRPNDWQKSLQLGTERPSPTSPVNQARQQFFGDVIAVVAESHASIRVPTPSNQNWVQFASGPFGYWGLSAATGSRLRIDAYLDCGDQVRNKELFDWFHADRHRWETELGFPLEWERLDDKRAARFAVYHDGFDVEGDLSGLREWATAHLSSMFGVLNGPLREEAQRIRKEHQSMVAASDDESDRDADE